MVISLLGIIGVLVLPILDKPFQVYQASRAYQQAADNAVHMMHWLERDLGQGVSSIDVTPLGDLIIKKGVRAFVTALRAQPQDTEETMPDLEKAGGKTQRQKLYRAQHVEGVIEDLIEHTVADHMVQTSFEWHSPVLTVGLDVQRFGGGQVSFWREWTVILEVQE